MSKLDLSKFKKVGSSEHATVLQHPAGHTITIAHKPLSSKMRASLDALPHFDGGGPVLTAKEFDDSFNSVPKPKSVTLGPTNSSVNTAEAVQKGRTETAAAHQGEPQFAPACNNPTTNLQTGEAECHAKGGRVGYDDGGPVSKEGWSAFQSGFNGTPQPKPSPSQTPSQNHADGGEVEDDGGASLAKLAPLLMAMAKGGKVKDPSQRNLLPGDAIPNRIEQQVVGQTKQRMASGGEAQFAPSQAPDTQNFADGTPDAPVQQAAPADQNASQQAPAEQNSSQQPPEAYAPQKQAYQPDQAAPQPTGPNAQYTPLYSNELNQVSQNNPGLPPVLQQQMAVDAALRDKSAMQYDSQANLSAQQMAHNNALAQNSKLEQLGLPPNPVPDAPQSAQPQAADPNAVKNYADAANNLIAQPADAKDPYGMDAQINMWKQGLGQKIKGIQAEALAAGQMGGQNAMGYQDNINELRNTMSHYDSQVQDLNQERLHNKQDIENSYIDPQKYIQGLSTGSQILAIIGSGIGGGAAGITGGPNLAYQALQSNIARSIDAQKTNLAAKENLLANTMDQYGNIKDATAMHHALTNDILANYIQKTSAQYADPMAQARAKQMVGQLYIDSSNMVGQTAMRRTMMNLAVGSGQDPDKFGKYLQVLRVMNPEMAKTLEQQYVPGIGVANLPVPQAVRDKLLAHQQLDSSIQDLHKFVNTHSTLVPGTPDYNVGQQKARALQTMVRSGMLGTVYREGEQPLLDKFVNSNPAGMMKYLKTIPQLNELTGTNTRNFNMLKHSVGLPTPPGVGASGAYVPRTAQKVK